MLLGITRLTGHQVLIRNDRLTGTTRLTGHQVLIRNDLLTGNAGLTGHQVLIRNDLLTENAGLTGNDGLTGHYTGRHLCHAGNPSHWHALDNGLAGHHWLCRHCRDTLGLWGQRRIDRELLGHNGGRVRLRRHHTGRSSRSGLGGRQSCRVNTGHGRSSAKVPMGNATGDHPLVLYVLRHVLLL